MTKVNASHHESASFKPTNTTTTTSTINNARPLQANTNTATKATLSKCSKLNVRYVKKPTIVGRGITTALPPHPHNYNYQQQHHYNVNKKYTFRK